MFLCFPDHAYQIEKEKMLNMRRKTALLQAYSKKCEDTMAQYTEHMNCINKQVEDVRTRAQYVSLAKIVKQK